MLEDLGFTEGVLLRIFVREDERHGVAPVYDAIVREARDRRVAGATVVRGVEGFGNRRAVHRSGAFSFVTKTPILVEIADTEEKIDALVPTILAMVPEGVLT